ncbi:inhibitor of nuclear factor kappa-B kinase-interacting protein isoform X1 [Heptranchias perlo]|uniref:inhibitor of nuclear factor kappa-B kinase-interacting protein isoform X1 n=1 Tax=Heptranchias perlo TaxID=212740 RepID=UPI003559C497
MSSEVKQRKKNVAASKQSDGVREQNVKGKVSEEPEPETERCSKGSPAGRREVDVRSALCLLSLLASAALAGIMFQQSAKFADVELKYQQLYMKSVAAQALENEISKVSKKLWTSFESPLSALGTPCTRNQQSNPDFTTSCAAHWSSIALQWSSEWCKSAQEIVDKLKDHSLLKQVEDLQTEIMKMKTWSSSITEKRNELHEKLVSLSDTIERIEKSTVDISNDVSTKLSGVRTDIRRISGLDSDISSLKDSLHELENKVTNVEKTAIHKIGDLIATSVERVTQLKNLVSGNTDKIELLQKKFTELKAEDNKLSDRLYSLENSRSKLIKAIMFANDLKPKVYNLKKEFSLLEPQVNDLIGRIGRISFDLQKRNEEIANLRKKISNCTGNSNDIQGAKD